MLWLDADRVVDESLAQSARAGAVVCVPGKRYKLIVFFLRYAPNWLKNGTQRKYGKTRTE